MRCNVADNWGSRTRSYNVGRVVGVVVFMLGNT